MAVPWQKEIYKKNFQVLSKDQSSKEQFRGQTPNLEKAKPKLFVQSQGESYQLNNPTPAKQRPSAALRLFSSSMGSPSLPFPTPDRNVHRMQHSPTMLWMSSAARATPAAAGGDRPTVQKAHPFPESIALQIASTLPT